jgi:hypothetical protein
MSEIKVIRTDKSTYEQYVKEGLWKPKTNVKFNRGISGIVESEVKVKGKKEKCILASIIITDYFDYDPHRWDR